MTVKTFWTIFLKIFGLYLVWQIISFLPTFVSWINYLGSADAKSLLIAIIILCLILGFFILVARYSIFKTDWIIEKLKLEKGFADDRIEINIHRSSLLSIAIIVLGGLLLADGLPMFGYNVFTYIKYSNEYQYKGIWDNRNTPALVSSLLKVLIGYFMVADSRLIVNFIERKRKKSTTDPLLAGEEKSELE